MLLPVDSQQTRALNPFLLPPQAALEFLFLPEVKFVASALMATSLFSKLSLA